MEEVSLSVKVGIYYFKSGEKFDTEWKDDEPSKYSTEYEFIVGVFFYGNNDKYEGDWNNNPNGKGKGSNKSRDNALCKWR